MRSEFYTCSLIKGMIHGDQNIHLTIINKENIAENVNSIKCKVT